MKYSVCTSFSPEGYKVYGRVFIESFLKYWPEDVPLMCVIEREVPDLKDPRITYRDLWDDVDWCRFYDKWKRDPQVASNHHTWGALKFSRKIFALNGEQFPSQWLLWIDADVETRVKIGPEFFELTCPDDKAISYLNREFWRYSECGFVGYNREAEGATELLAAVKGMYVSGAFHSLSEWGDSFVWDVCRRQIYGGDKHPLLHRLVEEKDVTGINVWPRSPLGRWMTHHKGPSRKRARFGSAV